MKKKLYMLDLDEGGVAIIAESIAEAREIAFSCDELDRVWIDMTMDLHRKKTDIDLSALPIGGVDTEKAIRLGIYSGVEDGKDFGLVCDECGEDKGYFYGDNGNLLCIDCYDYED